MQHKKTLATVKFGGTPFNLYPIQTEKIREYSLCAPSSSPKHCHLPATHRVKAHSLTSTAKDSNTPCASKLAAGFSTLCWACPIAGQGRKLAGVGSRLHF